MEEMNFKRRLFSGAGIVALVGALAAGFTSHSWAHGGFGGGHRGGFMRGDPAKMDERIERMVKHFAVEVDATPEQSAKLTEIAKSAAKELRPLREKVGDARRRGMALLAAPTIDRAAIERLRVEQVQAMDAISKRMSQVLADAAEVLTPDQRKKLADRFQRRQHRQRG